MRRLMLEVTVLAAAVAATAAITAGGATTAGKLALFAQLRGSHEVGANGQGNAGDPDGRGSFTALIEGRKLCFGIAVTGIDKPVAAHVHKGAVGSNGAVVVPLRQPRAGKPGASSGCVSAGTAVLGDIRAHPGSYYANVHTSDFPDGALRGQLFSPTSKQDR